MTLKLFTTPMTCQRDGLEHRVTDEAVAEGQCGEFESVCGVTLLAAPMVAPCGPPCPRCRAVLAATCTPAPVRMTARPSRGWRSWLRAGMTPGRHAR